MLKTKKTKKTREIDRDPNLLLRRRKTEKDLEIEISKTRDANLDPALETEIEARDRETIAEKTTDLDLDPEIDRREIKGIDRDRGTGSITGIDRDPERGSIDPLDRPQRTGDAIEDDRVTGACVREWFVQGKWIKR